MSSFLRTLTVLTGTAAVVAFVATSASADGFRLILSGPAIAAALGTRTTSSTPDLGALPPELAELKWPTRPSTTREVTVTTADALAAEAAVPGTRILARGVVGGDLTVNADDVEIVADDATSLGTLHVPMSRARVRVEGGSWRGVRVAIPATFQGGADYRPEYMVQDLWLEKMTIDAGGESALEVRGKRIALVGSRVRAGRYSVWCGDTDPMQTEDLVLYDNVFESAGPESTVRLVSVLRSAVVSNVLTNTFKHNYRIHGRSDLNFASDNLLVTTGVMMGTMPGDDLGRVWFDDNVLHHDAPDLFNPGAIRELKARRNLVHANGRSAMYDGAPPAGWDLTENVVVPYAPPPPY
jgi:hypothetical protein